MNIFCPEFTTCVYNCHEITVTLFISGGKEMDPPPPSSFHLPPASSSSTHLHPPTPSLFEPPPSSLQHPQLYENQNVARNWTISPNSGRENSKLSVFPENRHIWYLGGATSESVIIFLKFQPIFWQICNQKVKIAVLPQN